MNKKELVNEILMSGKIRENEEVLFECIPELKIMKNFEHKHPHHNLDVWEHTIKVIENLDGEELEIKMAALLHDIGKPESCTEEVYQNEYCEDSVIRHFRGHPKVSAEIAKKILVELNYDDEFKRDVNYLVEKHDTIIKTSKLDNSIDMVEKRLKLQYADAKAHHPDTVEKRIRILDEIKDEIEEKLKVYVELI